MTEDYTELDEFLEVRDDAEARNMLRACLKQDDPILIKSEKELHEVVYPKYHKLRSQIIGEHEKLAQIRDVFRTFEWTHEAAYYAMKEIARIINEGKT